MNAFVLGVPIILIRYGVVKFLGGSTEKRTDFFPPTKGTEDKALLIYQLSIIFLFGYLFFSTIQVNTSINRIGLFFYIFGGLLYCKAIIDFSKTDDRGFSSQGIYQFSRNPMYVSFFLYFLGCSLLIESIIYLIVLIVFQIAVHWIILSEERWCKQQFGERYQTYMKQVRRYL